MIIIYIEYKINHKVNIVTGLSNQYTKKCQDEARQQVVGTVVNFILMFHLRIVIHLPLFSFDTLGPTNLVHNKFGCHNLIFIWPSRGYFMVVSYFNLR